MKKIFRLLLPPPSWRMPVAIMLGIFVGLGAYTLKVSNAVSYLSDDPQTCVNCHIMNPQYATWQHSSHRENASCNDCHVPQDNVFNKYFFKAKDGMRHATMFTLRLEPQVIEITEAGKNVVQNNCKRCHNHINENVSTMAVTGKNYTHGEGQLCFECHREVPHGRVNSLSSAPYARIKPITNTLPEWIKEAIKTE